MIFPETIVLMLSVRCAGGHQDVGMVGRDGMVGWSHVLGDSMPFDARVVVQSGSALLIPAARFAEMTGEDAEWLRLAVRFSQRLGYQVARNLASGLGDSAERRLARLLLMLHERLESDELPVTHLFLATTLNIRRATVTDTLHILEGSRLLRCTRGRIVIRDADALRACAGPAHGPGEQAVF